MSDDIITTDHPLSAGQRSRLAALADTLVPASSDGRLPSAAEVDLVNAVERTAPDVLPRLAAAADAFEDAFADLDLDARVARVQAFSESEPELFAELIFRVYGAYYEDERVKAAIGVGAGAPFPRGNSIEPGDLSLLDPVVAASHHYRRT